MSKRVTVVIPVYGAWNELENCIKSLQAHLDQRHHVLIVNDLGPEADSIEAGVLEAIKGHTNFSYQRNPKNLGFLGNCNRAVLELEKTTNDILLLNSDTQITAGAVEEMLDVLHSSAKIGVVSPRSNNATICTIPIDAISQKGIEAEKSYQLFLKHKDRFERYNEVPTAHGFCMLIKRQLIEEHGLFDPAFGAGYGEEVDFCQRLGQKGYTSVICNRAYVFHLEARSFTPERKAKLLEENNKIIRSRYPHYQKAVADYIATAKAKEAKILGTSLFTRLFRNR